MSPFTNLEPFLFWTIACITGGCAIACVVTHNIVRSATWLLFALAGTSGIFFLLGADLVGAIQLLVYVGGTMILVVFGVMLTAQGPFISMRTSSGEWAVSVAAGLLLLSVLSVAISKIGKPTPPSGSTVAQYAPKTTLAEGMTKEGETNEVASKSPYSMAIGQGFLGVGVGPAHKETVNGKETVVRASYLLPFEIVSVHLLVALIGAAYLARAKRRKEAAV
ncbi:MAG: NADH-quinone oxidoreductase subunit J [Gemmataceae bacterium]|nr:NADH-quinone oxidoreductase subunit J [Gemmataceae bacterium]